MVLHTFSAGLLKPNIYAGMKYFFLGLKNSLLVAEKPNGSDERLCAFCLAHYIPLFISLDIIIIILIVVFLIYCGNILTVNHIIIIIVEEIFKL